MKLVRERMYKRAWVTSHKATGISREDKRAPKQHARQKDGYTAGLPFDQSQTQINLPLLDDNTTEVRMIERLQMPLFPGMLDQPLPPVADVDVPDDLDDTLPKGDLPGQLLLDIAL